MSRVTVFAGLVVLACGTTEDVPVDVGPVVLSVEPQWTTARRLEGEPVLEVGADAGESPAAFAEVAAVRFLEGGRFVASDNGAEHVVFDSVGRHVVTLGRPGPGPDEFTDVAMVYAYPGDSVAAFDFGLNRTLVFPVDQGPSRVISAIHAENRAVVLGVLGSGSLMSRLPIRTSSRSRWDSTAIILVDRAGASSQEVSRVGGRVTSAPGGPPATLSPRSILAAAEDGFYWARSDRYEILRFDSLGVLQYVIRRPIEPTSIGSREASEYTEATLSEIRARQGEERARAIDAQLRSVGYAETRPLFGSAFVDKDQRLWVSELPWPSRYVPPRVWSVFDDEGVWLGDVETPEGLVLHDAQADNVLGVWRDELGLAYVRVYRMVAG